MAEESAEATPSSTIAQIKKKAVADYIALESSPAYRKLSKSWNNSDARTHSNQKKRPDVGLVKATPADSNGRLLIRSFVKNGWSDIKIVRLHQEIEAFYETVTPKPEEETAREGVIQRITAAVHHLWSGARVEVFGSCKTKLYLPSSDVDLVVFGCWDCKPLHTLKDELVRRGICDEQSTRVLNTASVPIIKLTDRVTGIKTDIAFNITNGLTGAEIIQRFVEEFPSLRYLVLVLKHFVQQRDLNEVYTGGIGSYSLILLLVSFLQMHSRNEGRQKDVNLGVLLLEFFELYGLHFNYRKAGISVADNGKYVRKGSDSFGELSLYIEDPVDADNDVARGTYNFSQIQIAFAHAYHALCNKVLDQADDASSSRDRPILSCIIEYECDKDVPLMQSLDETPASSSSIAKKNSDRKRKRSLSKSHSKEMSFNSGRKKYGDVSINSEKKKKKRLMVKDSYDQGAYSKSPKERRR